MLPAKSPQDQYVETVIQRHPPALIATGALDALAGSIRAWAGVYLLELKPSGSYAKGTAVAGSADIDLLVSLRNDVLSGNTPDLATLYQSLNAWLSGAGFTTQPQNVSIGVFLPGLKIDIVPAVRQPGNTNDHSIFKRKANSWRKTNIDAHINAVRNSGRITDIKAIKIWRNVHTLDFPSFLLELVVLDALNGKALYNPATNFMHVMEFLESKFVTCRLIDPANTANIVSDDLSGAEKAIVARQAAASRGQPTWGTIIW